MTANLQHLSKHTRLPDFPRYLELEDPQDMVPPQDRDPDLLPEWCEAFRVTRLDHESSRQAESTGLPGWVSDIFVKTLVFCQCHPCSCRRANTTVDIQQLFFTHQMSASFFHVFHLSTLMYLYAMTSHHPTNVVLPCHFKGVPVVCSLLFFLHNGYKLTYCNNEGKIMFITENYYNKICMFFNAPGSGWVCGVTCWQ